MTQALTRICALAVLALLTASISSAPARRLPPPDVLEACPSFLKLDQFSDAEPLSDEDRLALADLRDLIRARAGTGDTPTSIFKQGPLFAALIPGLASGADDASAVHFQPRTLILVTRVNAVNYEVVHRLRSPRYRFLSFLSQGPLTTMRFFGDSDIEIGLTGSPQKLTAFSVTTMADDPDFERNACDDTPDNN